MAKLKKDAVDRTGLLERCLKRLEWEKQREAEDKAAADKAEAERIAMQSIDWYIFCYSTHQQISYGKAIALFQGCCIVVQP